MKSTPTEEDNIDGARFAQEMIKLDNVEQAGEAERPLRTGNQLDHGSPKNGTKIDDEETKCGLGSCHPSWMQMFASKKTYVLVYSAIGLMDTAVGSYSSAVISTLEKRFKIPSRTSGIIASGVDIGFLCCCIWLAYLGSRGHKTRWVAAGIFMIAISCFFRYLPHLIFGSGKDALDLTLEYDAAFNSSGYFLNYNNSAGDSARAFLCNTNVEYEEDCSFSSTSAWPASLLFLASAIFGAGTSMYHTLGIAYLDDNVRKNKTPFLIAVVQCVRLVGPTVGFMLGSYALLLYIEPDLHPTITNEDPRWIGAWWLGWMPMGLVFFVLAILLMLFPRKLPQAAKRNQLDKPFPKPSFSDFKNVMNRLVQNKVLVLNSFSSVFFMFGTMGFWVFMPKYMETQFRQSASQSSLITGSVGIIFSALGVMASGTVISMFKPSPRNVAAWNVVVEGLEAVSHILYAFLGCSIEDLHGSLSSDDSWQLKATCNTDCACGPEMKYFPVCSREDKITFYSPCHAGCTTIDIINGTKIFGNCSCIANGEGMAMDGVCPVECATQFITFLVIRSFVTFLSSSGRAGNMIVQFRCVEQNDKSLSIGFTEVLLCVLAYIPAPIVYGMLLDSTCVVWGQTCEQTGNCWWYNGQRMAFLLNFTASGFLFLGTLLDIGVWYYVKDLQMYDEDSEKEEEKRKNENNKSSSEILQ